jgi:hypothetical protein
MGLKPQTTHVETCMDLSSDAGSIPAASTNLVVQLATGERHLAREDRQGERAVIAPPPLHILVS